MTTMPSDVAESGADVSKEPSVTVTAIEDSLRAWVSDAAAAAGFTLALPVGDPPAVPLVSAWLHKTQVVPSPSDRKGPGEIRVRLHYLLTVWCADEAQAHAVWQDLLLAALGVTPTSRPLPGTHQPEPPTDAFWQALRLPPRPAVGLLAEITLRRPAKAPPKPPRLVQVHGHADPARFTPNLNH